MSKEKFDPTLWSSLTQYMSVLKTAVRSWKHFLVHKFSDDYFTRKDVTEWMESIENTFSVLEDTYLYDTMRSLSLYPHASGLPDRLHLEILKSEFENAHVDEGKLKRAFLDHLFKEGIANCWLLEKIANKRAQNKLEHTEPLRQFHIRRVQRLEGENDSLYVCCFERYCYRHIPSLYLVLFTYTGEEDVSQVICNEMFSVFREGTSNMPKLGNLAMQIDGAHVDVHPQWIGRISLGPLFVSKLTQDDHELQAVLDDLHIDGSHEHASRIIYEYVMSEGENTVSNVYDPKGRRHKVLQEFAVNGLDAECADRHVAYLEKHLFVSHKIGQLLSEAFKKESNHIIQIHEES